MSGAAIMLSIINDSLASGALSSDVVKLSVDEISEDLANLRTTGEISNTFREVFGEYRPKEVF